MSDQFTTGTIVRITSPPPNVAPERIPPPPHYGMYVEAIHSGEQPQVVALWKGCSWIFDPADALGFEATEETASRSYCAGCAGWESPELEGVIVAHNGRRWDVYFSWNHVFYEVVNTTEVRSIPGLEGRTDEHVAKLLGWSS